MSGAKGSSYDWQRGFTIDFSLMDGLSKKGTPTRRRLSQMRGMYRDEAAFDEQVKNGDPLVYEFFELGVPEHAGDIAFGTSITYPGKVGDEFFMTKGHFHTVLATAEVYYTLSGQGRMMTESPEGDVVVHDLVPGVAVYIPQRYAHRSVNVGGTPLVTFFAFRGDAGHDYGTIETKGYRKLVVERGGKVEVVDNPKWK